MADQVAADRQWALTLVAGGNEAYNRWYTLEETVQNKEDVEQVWQAFEKSFEQSSSFWHFRDAYLADVRQADTETSADLDLCIKQIVKGCQWVKETEEQRMIELLYHATIYYEIRKYIQEADPKTLKYEAIIEKAKAHERNCLEYKDHQASHGGVNSVPSYNNPLLSAHAINKHRPSGRNQSHQCGKCGNLMSEATVPLTGELVTNAKVLITLKRCVVQRYQTGQPRALTRSHNINSQGERLRAAMAKEEASSSSRRRRLRSNHQSRKRTR